MCAMCMVTSLTWIERESAIYGSHQYLVTRGPVREEVGVRVGGEGEGRARVSERVSEGVRVRG
jgi:hypothetical protein